MRIDRQTYEEFFLLYNDGELDMEERRAVEEFIRENPDLEQELIMLQGAVYTPDEKIVFENKEVLYRKEAKVISFYWMRVAAAAAVMLVLTIAGSIYLREGNDQPENNLASRELIKAPPSSEETQEMTTTEPQVTTVSETTMSPSQKLGKTAYSKAVLTVIKTPVIRETIQEKGHAGSEQDTQNEIKAQNILEPARLEHDVVENTSAVEEITTKVAPQQIEQEMALTTTATKIVYAEEDDNNMIYFANTSLPKKTKLRGVFRKATRILDKVTSFQ